MEDYKFQAAINGADVGDNDSSETAQTTTGTATLPQFGDPESYAHLSAEVREKMTAEMMQTHTTWVNNMSQQ